MKVYFMEGGYIDFKLCLELEFDLVKYLKVLYNISWVFVERVVLGMGIVVIY